MKGKAIKRKGSDGVRAASVRGAIALVSLVALTQTPAAAAVSGPGAPAPAGKTPTVSFESIPGSTVKRVTLSSRAAERLDIQMGKVAEQAILRRQIVGGLIIPPVGTAPEQKPSGGSFGGFAKGSFAPAAPPAAGLAPASGELWVMIALSPAEVARLDNAKPARLLPLATRADFSKEIVALPSGRPPLEDTKHSMLTVYYVVSGKDSGLARNNRVRVELPLAGSAEPQKVVPYSSVYYDAKGGAWAYVSTSPLVYERQRIVVERVVGDLAVLSEGPPVGTAVVTVGASLLYGAEIFGK